MIGATLVLGYLAADSAFRRDELREIPLTLGERPPAHRKVEVALKEDAPTAANALRRNWLGSE